MTEDLLQSGDPNIESPMGEPIDYHQKWSQYYEVDRVKFDDVDEEITRRERYNNLPRVLLNKGSSTNLQVLVEIKNDMPKMFESEEELGQEMKKKEFIQKQMEAVGVRRKEAKRHLILKRRKKINSQQYQELVDFVGKMEEIIQAGSQDGDKYQDFAQ